MNENPKVHRRLEDRLAAAKAGKALRIVVKGNCKVCKRRSADVPATKNQVIAWFTEGKTDGFPKYAVAMLETGVHRECQAVARQRARGKKVAAPAQRQVADLGAATLERMERVMARKKRRAAA